MDKRLINRLIVAIVIVALLVIFVPMLFTQHQYTKQIHVKRIPTEPTLPVYQDKTTPINTMSSTTAKIDEGAQPAVTSDQLNSQPNDQTLAAPFTPTADLNSSTYRLSEAKSVSHAWVVQLTVFDDQKKADDFVEKLHLKGYTAFDYKTQAGIQVYLGPVAKEKEANEMLSKIKKSFNISGTVQPFDALHLY
jgi:DedD protein